MAIDTAAKRYSAIQTLLPWRGMHIVPDAAFPVGQRQAAAFLYYGISSSPLVITFAGSGKQFIGEIQTIGGDSILDASMGIT